MDDNNKLQHNFIICIYDDHYEVVGPFTTIEALQHWGTMWQQNNDDRPTWQSLYLDDTSLEPQFVEPLEHRK